MKKYLFIYFVIFLCIFQLEGQDEQCNNTPYSSVATQNYGSSLNSMALSDVVVKVYFLAYSDDDGFGGVTAAEIQSIFDQMVTYFTNTGISFHYLPCETQFIKNSILFESSDRCDFFDTTRHTDGIGIHLKGRNQQLGVASKIPGDEILIGGIWLD